MTIARSDSRDAVIDIPDDFMARVAPGMEFNVRLQESPRITAKAKVREITPLADPITPVAPCAAHARGSGRRVPHRHHHRRRIRPRHRAENSRPLGRGRRRRRRAATSGCSADNGTKVARRVIEIAGTEGDHAVVKSGLAAGDRVVVVGVHSLHDGQAVAGEAGTASKAEATKL